MTRSFHCPRNRFAQLLTFKRLKRMLAGARLLGLGTILFCAPGLYAQAPSLVWRTNVNASLFAMDSQTNVYANTNGTVITLNSLGIPFKTNALCPVSSLAP